MAIIPVYHQNFICPYCQKHVRLLSPTATHKCRAKTQADARQATNDTADDIGGLDDASKRKSVAFRGVMTQEQQEDGITEDDLLGHMKAAKNGVADAAKPPTYTGPRYVPPIKPLGKAKKRKRNDG